MANHAFMNTYIGTRQDNCIVVSLATHMQSMCLCRTALTPGGGG